MVTILDYNTEVSLVVSAIPSDDIVEFEAKAAAKFDTESDSNELFNIPLDDEMRDLEISVLQVSPKQVDKPSDSSHVFDDTIKDQDETGDMENAVNQASSNQIQEASDSDGSDHVYDDTVNLVTRQNFILNSSTGHLNTSAGPLNTSNGYLNASTGCLNGSQCMPKSSSMHFSEDLQQRDEYVDEDEMDG